jgi:hypothetical protein
VENGLAESPLAAAVHAFRTFFFEVSCHHLWKEMLLRGSEVFVGVQDGYCSTNPHCGWINEVCCPGNGCFEGECKDGKCVAKPVVITPPVDTSACGDPDWPCCNEAQRSFLQTTDPCSKTPSGVCCDGVCKSGSCPTYVALLTWQRSINALLVLVTFNA